MVLFQQTTKVLYIFTETVPPMFFNTFLDILELVLKLAMFVPYLEEFSFKNSATARIICFWCKLISSIIVIMVCA